VIGFLIFVFCLSHGTSCQKKVFLADRLWFSDYVFAVNQVAYLYNSAKINEIHPLENMKQEKGLSLSSLSLLAAVARFGLLFSSLRAGKLA
jgi:hypothetical protein